MDVYFDDYDDKSGDYFRLDYDPSFSFHAGKNLIAIRGNSDTMNIGTELIIEAIDANGDIVRTQIYDLNNDAHERVISVEITPTTPAGDVILSIIGSAAVAPDGGAIPSEWRGVPNMRWTRVFTAKTHMPNKSPITYNDSLPQITISEISKPFYKLHFNSELSTSLNWTGNETASYNLTTGHNTDCKVSYQKSGGKTFITATDGSGGNILDFGGFTQDMEGGIIIVRTPDTPRPSGINGYSSPPVFAEDEIGDGLYEDVAYLGSNPTIPTMSFIPGGYMTTILEVISPFQARTSEPHTTQQGLTAASYQEFEHFEFNPSPFELVWAQMPISYSADPTGSQGEELRNSYALVKFDNLEPLTGDVTRIKCYMKNHQAPFDWVLASDNAIWAQELLYRKDYEKHRHPIGDMSQWGVGINTGSLERYWETLGVGTPPPSMSIYTQGGAGENPPVEDNLQIGDNQQALELDGTAYWWLRAKESASFYEDQYYELSLKAVSVKTVSPSWTTLPQQPILEPKIAIYMTGSAFTEVATGGAALTGYGKYLGKIEDTSVRKKHVEFDEHDNKKEIGYKFLFKADGTEGGIPQFKIESGIWHIWDVSIKPWDRKGFTPGTFDVIFPTVKANVGNPDALDFKFEFYNDYGQIANYTAVIEKQPWTNEYTVVFTHIHTNFLQITDEVVFENTFSLFTASDGYDPTGSYAQIQTTNNFTITGSGGISTSFFVDPADPGHKVLMIDGAGSSGGGGGWTASNAGGSGGNSTVNPGDTVTFQGSGATTVAQSGNTLTFSSPTSDNYAKWIVGVVGGADQNVLSNNYLRFAAGAGISLAGSTGAGSNANPHLITITGTGGGDGGMNTGCISVWPWEQGEGVNPIVGYEWCAGTLGLDTASSVPTQGNTIGCPTTIGYVGASLVTPQLTAEYNSFYAEKTWLQVNNWSGPELIEKKSDVTYAAIFNTTGVPITEGGDSSCDRGAVQAGHGVKIMTSTKPIGVTFKSFNKVTNTATTKTTCGASQYQLPGPMVGNSYLEPKAKSWAPGVGITGLPNAYYLAFYHFDHDDNKQTFAGGIRKHCNSYTNTIIIEYSSDRRIKEEIEDTRWSIDTLMDIKVRDYHYKQTPLDRREDKMTGFIAQELQEVYPQAAFGDEYGDVEKAPMTVAPDKLIPLMIKSMQDQQKLIEELSKKIEKLENK
tara:strand:+ start:27206 stop:30745 length:3540 start_codon:yes stop_codon:yes gene_type:complete